MYVCVYIYIYIRKGLVQRLEGGPLPVAGARRGRVHALLLLLVLLITITIVTIIIIIIDITITIIIVIITTIIIIIIIIITIVITSPVAGARRGRVHALPGRRDAVQPGGGGLPLAHDARLPTIIIIIIIIITIAVITIPIITITITTITIIIIIIMTQPRLPLAGPARLPARQAPQLLIYIYIYIYDTYI